MLPVSFFEDGPVGGLFNSRWTQTPATRRDRSDIPNCAADSGDLADEHREKITPDRLVMCENCCLLPQAEIEKDSPVHCADITLQLSNRVLGQPRERALSFIS